MSPLQAAQYVAVGLGAFLGFGIVATFLAWVSGGC
ncbi:hypothetical protein LCGC14_0834800 [marine sediment metagenome]|uniref:Uncharacterized protein n=1 Tax=marine sediment metagenome TaxID=412755 RepID=A0A0F9Q075_9ZZZZ